MSDDQPKQPQDKSPSDKSIEDLQFRIAMDELYTHLHRAVEIIHTWRYTAVAKCGLTSQAEIGFAELRLKHWLEEHADQEEIISPAQFFAILHEKLKGNED